MKLPDLDWNGAVRIARADEALAKYNDDESRDWHGRWTDGDDGEPTSIANDNVAIPTVQAAQNEQAASLPPAQSTDSLALPADWVRFPPGGKPRIDELADFAEWIANAKPEDGPALYAEAKRLFFHVGDSYGGSAVCGIISDAIQPGLSVENRRELLDSLDRYTHTDPADMAVDRALAISGGLLSFPEMLAEAPAVATATESAELATRSSVWKLGWAARGQEIDRAFGNTLGFNFPVIDSFAEGLATSIKSIDLEAGTYQSGARLLARINKYVEDLSNFDGARWGGANVPLGATRARTLRLVIPRGSGTLEQETAIRAAQVRATAASRPVKIIVSPY